MFTRLYISIIVTKEEEYGLPYVCIYIYARWHIAQVEIIGRTIGTNIISLRTESREDYICMIILHTRLAPYNGKRDLCIGGSAPSDSTCYYTM